MATVGERDELRGLVAELGLRPLSTRSLVLSVLLGTRPPRLDAARLVAFGERLGARAGTTRTALSRLVASGDLVVDDATYALSDRLRERQRQQTLGDAADDHLDGWSGSWWTAIVVGDAPRTSTERRHFRSSMVGLRFGELRPELWMRPDDLDPPVDRTDVLVTRGPVDAPFDDRALAERLWDLAAVERRASRVVESIERMHDVLDDGDDEALRLAFEVAAVCVGFLRVEPRLPEALAPMPMTRRVRTSYPALESRFQSMLRSSAAAPSAR